MNYLERLPDELQELIMDYKRTKEQKEARVYNIMDKMNSLENSITDVYNSTDFLTMKDMVKMQRMVDAYEVAKAWLILEDRYDNNPRDEMGITAYVLEVDNIITGLKSVACGNYL